MNGSPEALPDPREVVERKRDRGQLTREEMRSFILGYARGDIPDYLAAAFLTACYLNGLSIEETTELTQAMVDSGRTIALLDVDRPKVDKHSTGGVSDSVTLVFVPLAASLGLAVAKLSGRGLGHTGGTLDKLESIPGLRTDLSVDEFEAQVARIGCVVAGQTEDLVPADGAMYALRDATGTVASIPLIAASVMSKKLAVNSDLILLDVKAGSGAFMKTPESAAELARTCVLLAAGAGRRARVAVTDMTRPLGTAIGNALDVAEAVRILRGEERGRLRDLSVRFAGVAVSSLLGGSQAEAEQRAEAALDGGAALDTFALMVETQGGDHRVAEDPAGVLPRAPHRVDMALDRTGFVVEIDAEALGRAAAQLGAGRVRKGDPVDPAVGIEFTATVGDHVEAGQPVGTIHSRTPEDAARAEAVVRGAVTVGDEAADPPPMVFGWYDSDDVEEAGG
jgi:pyrimidine-nucleoside phosphorylase